MVDVTAQEFQEDVNNTADWANGDENTTVTMRLGQTARSPAKVINDIQLQANSAIEEINLSRGFRVVGNFSDGFTYELYNDVGIYDDGLGNPDSITSWIYVGAGAPDKIVTAGTNPVGDSDYQQVTYNNADNIIFDQEQLSAFLSRVAVGDNGGYQPRLQACAIRNTGSGWAFIDDTAHEPLGLTGITTLPNGRIQIDHAIGAIEVGGLIVGADETLAKRGIIAGASVGLNNSFIDIGSILNFTVDTTLADVSSDPMWDGDITAEITNGVCNVTHPVCDGGDLPAISPIGSVNPRTDISLSYSSSQTNIVPMSNISGYISYNGSSWAYTGKMVDEPDISWDIAENELVVNHVMSDDTDISITARAGGVDAKPDSVGPTFFQVKFYDASGTLITTPSTDMKFFFSRKGYAKTSLRYGNFAVKRGYAKVDANKLVSGGGNLWILGIQNT